MVACANTTVLQLTHRADAVATTRTHLMPESLKSNLFRSRPSQHENFDWHMDDVGQCTVYVSP